MWIEFDNLFALENKIKDAAKALFDITHSTEQRLRGANLPYTRAGNYILVDSRNFDKYPELQVIHEEYKTLYDITLQSLGIVEELPTVTVNMADLTDSAQTLVLKRAKKTKE